MLVHFICRGNAFRSIIAEAYLNSLKVENWSASSSGTVAASHKERNQASHERTLKLLEQHGLRGFAKAGYGDQLTQQRVDRADLSVCLNQRVYDGCLRLVTFPAGPRVWSVADIGEPGRIVEVESDEWLYREAVYQEIIKNVDTLVADVRARGDGQPAGGKMP